MNRKIDVSVYLATPMTGYNCDELWIRAINDKQVYEKEAIKVTTPIDGEGIPFANIPLEDRSDAEMHRVWKKKDKSAIKANHVLVYELPTRWSQGIAHELILSRGVWWKPTVFVGKAGFITREEDDYVAASHTEAAKFIASTWGTRCQRIVWRLKMLNRCLPSWILGQLGEFK